MRTYRSALLSIGGLALCASMITFGPAMIPTTAFACPDEAGAAEGKCACGMDKATCDQVKANGGSCGCDHAKDAKGANAGEAGGCDQAADGAGCGGCDHDKAAKDGAGGCDHGKDAKACACAPGEGGKCACGADCPSEHGGKCTKEGAAAPADEKEGGCHGDKGEGASAAPSGGAGLQAAIDPATGELVTPEAAKAAGLTSGNAAVAEPNTGTRAAQEVAGGAGTMAEFPVNRVSRSVATVDADGNTHVGCQHAAE